MDQIVALIAARKWLPLAALALFLLVRILKDDTAIPLTVRNKRWYPWIPVIVAAAASALDKVVSGLSWSSAVTQAVFLGVVPVALQELGIKGVLGLQDLPLPTALQKNDPPPPPPPYRDGGAGLPPATGPGPSGMQRMGFVFALAAIGLLTGFVFAAGCSVFTPSNVRTAAELEEVTACALAHAEADSATLAKICQISADLQPLVDDIMTKHKTATAKTMSAAKCSGSAP